MKRTNARLHRGFLAFVMLAAFSGLAPGQSSYPDRPIKLLVGFAAGGGSDSIARLISPKLSAILNQPVLVDNRAGAGGAIAAEAVARSQPDGYTWLLVPSGHTTLAVVRKSLPFRPVDDFSWVSTITTYPMLLGVRPDSPYNTFADVLRAAAQRPGTVSYSSVGVGTGHHLLGEWLNAAGKVNMTHVPFKGGGAALTEVMAGRVDLLVETMTFALPVVQAGQIRPIAVTSAQPYPLLPNVPLVSNTLPGLEYESWLGIATAPNTPAPIVARIGDAIRAVLLQPDVQKRLAELGGQASPSTPQQFRERVERDIKRFGSIVETSKIERE
ncbi:MAG: tripartite tricarboxylate transporter substrate-binding protein [Pseudomonadota bacterium]